MAATPILRTPLGGDVKIVEQGTGTPVVFLHSGVGSAGEWKQVFSLWPQGYRLVAIEAYRAGSGPGVATRLSLDDYADWDVLFDDLLTLDALARLSAPVHVIEGSQTSAVDHAICDVVRRHVPHTEHTLIEGAGHMMPLTHPGPLTRALLTGIKK